MEREIKVIKIADHTFTIKTYATAAETNAIQSAYFRGAKVEVVGEQPKISEFDPTVQFTVSLELINQIVVDMDSLTEDIVERCKNLRNSEFEELVAALDDIASKKN